MIPLLSQFFFLHPTFSKLRELGLLVRALNWLGIAQTIFVVELHGNLVVRSSAIKAARLDASDIWHDLQLSVQRGAACRTEPMLVDFS